MRREDENVCKICIRREDEDTFKRKLKSEEG